jgi:ferredoxin
MQVVVHFSPSGRRVRVPSGTRLIDAAQRAGLPVARACGAEGLCARCGLHILEGGETLPRETARESSLKRRNRIDDSLRLSCQLRISSDLVVTAPYW